MRGRDEIFEINEAVEIITDLYNNHRGMAYKIVKDVLGDQVSLEVLDDMVQEGFLQMLDHAENLLGRSKREVMSYMRTTMLHTAINEGRRLSGRPSVSFTEILEREEWKEMPWYGIDLEEQILDEVQRKEMVNILYQALEELDPQEYDLIVGYYFFEVQDKVMEIWLGIKSAFIRVYRRRAVKKLARIYKRIVEEERTKRKK